MQELKSFNIVSTARIIGAVYFIIGEFAGVIIALASLARGYVGRAILALLFMGVVYGIATFVAVAIFAFLYNQIAERIGGIEFDLVQR
jgi:heme/copper-type cytochrome/quinol oxidase subunit 1